MSAPNRAGIEDHGGPSSSRGPARKTLLGEPAGSDSSKPMRGLPRSYPPADDSAVPQASNGSAAAGTSNGEASTAGGQRVRRKLPPTPPTMFYAPETAASPYLRMVPPLDVSQLGPEHLRNLNDRFRCLSCCESADSCEHIGMKRLPPSGLIPQTPDGFGAGCAGESHPSFPFIDPEVQKLMSHHWRTTERIRDEVLPRFEKLREKYGLPPSETSVRRPTIRFPKHMVEEGKAIIKQENAERNPVPTPSAIPKTTVPAVPATPQPAVQNGKGRQRHPAGDGRRLDPSEVVVLTPPPEDPVTKPLVKRKPAPKHKKHRKHK